MILWLITIFSARGQPICVEKVHDFWCATEGCTASMSFESLQLCCDKFEIQVGGKAATFYDQGSERYNWTDGRGSPWLLSVTHHITDLSKPYSHSSSIKSSEGAHSLLDYNGVSYLVYGRMTFSSWLTQAPTVHPTGIPTALPTNAPTENPTEYPTVLPTTAPTQNPTQVPTTLPTHNPTRTPTVLPTVIPTPRPTGIPTEIPTPKPTKMPTKNPTPKPTTPNPTAHPTGNPTLLPTTVPTPNPTKIPTALPTHYPSRGPTVIPSKNPTGKPTSIPTEIPTLKPTIKPTYSPSESPSNLPTGSPTVSPSESPTPMPTYVPSESPTNSPTANPTSSPTNLPSTSPSNNPTLRPSPRPTIYPTHVGVGGENDESYCSPSRKCSLGQGDCDTNNDCASGLTCGSNNCRSFHPTALPTADCCYDKPGIGASDDGSYCSVNRKCSVGQGDCNSNNDCAAGLTCGSNNCRSFHPNALSTHDCCYDKPGIGASDDGSFCSPSRKCSVGQGDCDSNNDCAAGLTCGSNNCRTFNPNALSSSDCCYDKPGIGASDDGSFCSPYRKCSVGQGDCDSNNDCAAGLTCGSNNCRSFHPNALSTSDCCYDKPGIGASDDNSYCTSSRQCSAGQGDCDKNSDCAAGLICGKDNCQQFHPNAQRISDCCYDGIGTAISLYRYYHSGIVDHFYTTSWSELGGGRSGWKYEGVQCKIYKSQVSGTVALYRYNGNGDHFYTTNINEIGTGTHGKVGRHGYKSEGVAGYCYPKRVSSSVVPLYRFMNNQYSDHFYTTSMSEGTRASLKYEGVACYVIKK